jgi:hypothetical protein
MISNSKAASGTAGASPAPESQRCPRWLSEEEYQLLEALASLIVPSDELGPGAHEAQVVAALEARLATSSERQQVYRSGLRSLEQITRRLCRQSLGDLPRPVQHAIFAALEQAHQKRHAGGTALHHRLRRKLRTWRYSRRGYTDAIALFPHLVRDVLETFYCSPVAWEWLGYQGPPLTRGWYLTLNSEADHG